MQPFANTDDSIDLTRGLARGDRQWWGHWEFEAGVGGCMLVGADGCIEMMTTGDYT